MKIERKNTQFLSFNCGYFENTGIKKHPEWKALSWSRGSHLWEQDGNRKQENFSEEEHFNFAS